jgi:hypothetical protein
VSRLSDQVEAKIARANRAFRVSNRVIAAARNDLESHGAWLDHHRTSWAEEVKRHRRLLQRKLAARALLRFVVGLVFALPFAIARSLQAKSKDSLAREARQGQSADPPLTRHDALQHRIRALGEQQSSASADPAHASPRQHARPKEFLLRLNGIRARVLAMLPNLLKRKSPVPALGSAALLLIALGAVREMISTAPADAPGPELRETLVLPPKAGKASITVAKAPPLVSGITLVANPPPAQTLHLPARTVADMMAIARPLPLAASANVAATPAAEEPPMPMPTAKPKSKRKSASRAPEPIPWWQQWSWIRLR